MNNVSKLLPVSALIAALGLAGAAHAGPSCLTRGQGPTEHFLGVQSISDINHWLTQGPLLVHNGHNMPVCTMLGASCNVSGGDIITVTGNLQGHLILHRTRPTGSPVMRDVARMLPSADGRYLSGLSKGSDGNDQHVFLYYRGTGHCTDSGLDYPAQAQCRFFEFEVFPAGVMQGDRPDAHDALWVSSSCPSAGQQPGGGTLSEPPL